MVFLCWQVIKKALARGYYAIAEKHFEEALKFDSQFAKAYSNLGLIYFALLSRGAFYHFMGETDKALADYSQVLNLDSSVDSTYRNRGNTYSKMGEYDKAIVDYTHALRLNSVSETYNARGDTFVLMEKFLCKK